MGRISLCVIVLALTGSIASSQEPTRSGNVRPAAFDSRPLPKSPADKGAEPATPPVDVPIEQLGEGFRLVGKLKRPLGELLRVQGVIVNRRGQGPNDGLHIRVFRVNGQATQELVEVKIQDYYGRDEIPNLVPGYTCELEGFETGGFVGVPAEAIKRGGELSQTPPYQFLHEFKVIEATDLQLQPFSPAEFLGRDMLVQGMAVTENGSAYIAGHNWKLLVDNGTPWPRAIEGKTVEARGVVRTIGNSSTYRLENSGKANNARLVHLQDQIGRPVVLRGTVVAQGGDYGFRYRGQMVRVEGLKELVAQTGLRGEAQVSGTLDLIRVTSDNISFAGERITRTEYFVRKATLKPIDPLLAIERAEPLE
jgi:hypothetical protein